MSQPDHDPLEEAVGCVRREELVAFPTETVWGLGADAHSEPATEALRRWKGRREDQPLAVLLAGPDHLEPEGFCVPAWARDWIDRFWPGPLTLVLPTRRPFARGVARGDGAVGVRCSSHPAATALATRVAEAGVGPITATSLNRSGEPPARTRDEARRCCGQEPGAPFVVDAEPDALGQAPSTVVDATGELPLLLRSSGILGPQIESLIRTGNAA